MNTVSTSHKEYSEGLDPDLRNFLISLANMEPEIIEWTEYRWVVKWRRPPLWIGRIFTISPSSCIDNIGYRYPSVLTDDLIWWLLPRWIEYKVFTDDPMCRYLIIHIFQQANIFVRDTKGIDSITESNEVEVAIQKLALTLDALKEKKDSIKRQPPSTPEEIGNILDI